MYPDFKELLSVLNAHRVKYLVVGAYAVSIHAQPRATKDIDILIEADADNAEAVFAALAQFGVPLQGLTSADFAEEGPFFRIGRDPIGVDILTTIPGVGFDAAWLRRVEDVIDQASGLKANFISRDDLVAAKLASGRPQDLADVDAIRRAIKSQEARLDRREPKIDLHSQPATNSQEKED
jgi:predicted nucleotidyltransferase